MEGTLERKQKLQLGGKKVRKVLLGVKKINKKMITIKPTRSANAKAAVSNNTDLHCNALILFSQAASRGWSSYHAVLHRHTLCFYQDRKDTLRVSDAPPAAERSAGEPLWRWWFGLRSRLVIRLFCRCRARRAACR